MNIFKMLAGAADTLDFIPGFDPVKDKKGVFSRLMSGATAQPAAPAMPAGMSAAPQPERNMGDIMGIMSQPAAPKPMKAPMPAEYTTPLSFLDVLNPFKDTRNIRINDQARFDQARAEYGAEQKRQQRAAYDAKLGQLMKGADLDPAALVAAFLNPEKFGESLAESYGANEFSAGSTFSLKGGPVQRAPQNNVTTTNSRNQPITINPNTGAQVGDALGPEELIKLAQGDELFDTGTSGVTHANTGMTDQQRAQLGIDRYNAKTARLNAENGDPSERFKDEQSARKEYLQQSKTFQDAQRAYDRIKATDTTSAAGQMGLVFQIMKMMDPGSSVREGEYASAKNTTGIPGQVLNAYNQARAGKFLTADQIINFTSMADDLYVTAAEEQGRVYDFYQSVATQNKFDVEHTVPELRNPRYMGDEGSDDGQVQSGDIVETDEGQFQFLGGDPNNEANWRAVNAQPEARETPMRFH